MSTFGLCVPRCSSSRSESCLMAEHMHSEKLFAVVLERRSINRWWTKHVGINVGGDFAGIAKHEKWGSASLASYYAAKLLRRRGCSFQDRKISTNV